MQRTSNLEFEEHPTSTRKASNAKVKKDLVKSGIGERPIDSSKLPNPYPEIRQQSQGVIRSSRQNLAKFKQSEEVLSVSTLSNEDFRKRQRSQLKAKYKQGLVI